MVYYNCENSEEICYAERDSRTESGNGRYAAGCAQEWKYREAEKMDGAFFDSYEEDGQLSLFGFEDIEPEPVKDEAEIRISRCTSCGKLLYVREAEKTWQSFCNNCNIRYVQKK